MYFVLSFAFTVLVTCFLTSTVCGLALILFKLRKTNEVLQHPYLKHKAFNRYPIAIRSTILMDYFFRLSFPKSKFWVVGQANQLLPHVEPAEIPNDIKWPLLGFWGGCFTGLAAMLTIWIVLLLIKIF